MEVLPSTRAETGGKLRVGPLPSIFNGQLMKGRSYGGGIGDPTGCRHVLGPLTLPSPEIPWNLDMLVERQDEED